ncbi:hypothetical protein L7F22_066241 [Adiantum nelumboides]|nr:hypothetical protein [Adiantum nelumboides]
MMTWHMYGTDDDVADLTLAATWQILRWLIFSLQLTLNCFSVISFSVIGFEALLFRHSLQSTLHLASLHVCVLDVSRSGRIQSEVQAFYCLAGCAIPAIYTHTGSAKRGIRQTMAPHFVLALTFLFAIIGISAADPTAYEVLASFGFPEGLLPKTVENAGADYVLDGSGAFELHLEGSCKFTIPGSYEVKYDSRIAGSIESDRLHSLTGISVHIFYMWWNIDAITVSGQDLTFQVGPFSSSFPAENFDENPMCSGRSHGHADH